MIITRTPFRVSFLGGGTDYPDWYRAEGGAVLSTTIDKYCYITCRRLPPFLGFRHRVVWRHIETVNSAAEILHPAVRAGLPFLGFDDAQGLEIHHQGDLPTRTGVGSSSAFTVGMIKALLALRGEEIDRHELAAKAIDFEHRVLQEAVGSQDQVAAAYGGLNLIRFHRDDSFEVEPLDIPGARLQEFESHLLMLYAGGERLASEVATQVIANLGKRGGALRRMTEMVDEGAALLRGQGDLSRFGDLLHEGWGLKRTLAEIVSTPAIDLIYDQAREAGAIGGKLLGAGGAGCMLLFVPPARHDQVREALPHVMWVPIGVDTVGSTIIYNDEPGSKVPVSAVRR